MQDVEDLQKLLLQKNDAGMQNYRKNNESQRTKFFLSAATS